MRPPPRRLLFQQLLSTGGGSALNANTEAHRFSASTARLASSRQGSLPSADIRLLPRPSRHRPRLRERLVVLELQLQLFEAAGTAFGPSRSPGSFDYNPDAAMPADPSCDSFLTAVFGVTLADITLVSYEFDYYACGRAFHWRDANYNGVSQQSGTIGGCP